MRIEERPTLLATIAKRVDEHYPYHVRTTTKVRPDRVDPYVYGQHASYVPEPGVRLWGFIDLDGFQKFKGSYSLEIVE